MLHFGLRRIQSVLGISSPPLERSGSDKRVGSKREPLRLAAWLLCVVWSVNTCRDQRLEEGGRRKGEGGLICFVVFGVFSLDGVRCSQWMAHFKGAVFVRCRFFSLVSHLRQSELSSVPCVDSLRLRAKSGTVSFAEGL